MHLHNYSDNISQTNDIRRYATELERIPVRGALKKPEDRRSQTFLEAASAISATSVESAPAKSAKPFGLWEKDAFGFADFIDIINPMQHTPVVATIYRNFSGDQIGAVPRVLGGALWGRIGGLVSGVANALVEWWSGKDIGDHIYAALFSPANKEPKAGAVAQNKPTRAAAVAGAAATGAAPKPQSAESAIITSSESALSARAAVYPNGLRSEILPLARAAQNSYEKHRTLGESNESLGRSTSRNRV